MSRLERIREAAVGQAEMTFKAAVARAEAEREAAGEYEKTTRAQQAPTPPPKRPSAPTAVPRLAAPQRAGAEAGAERQRSGARTRAGRAVSGPSPRRQAAAVG